LKDITKLVSSNEGILKFHLKMSEINSVMCHKSGMGNLILTASAIILKKKNLESHVEICAATMTNLIQCQSKLSNSIIFKHTLLLI
jgi:hypothetical protein